jgi:hypothetical protein
MARTPGVVAALAPAVDFTFDHQDLLFSPVPADVKDAKAP